MRQLSHISAPLHNSIGPFVKMLDAGVDLNLGADNIADLFMPFVDGDMWVECRLLMEAARYYEFERLAEVAWSVNERTENIGARRLYTVMERLLEEIAFAAGNSTGAQTLRIDAAYVDARLGELSGNEDLSRYVL